MTVEKSAAVKESGDNSGATDLINDSNGAQKMAVGNDIEKNDKTKRYYKKKAKSYSHVWG